MSILLYVRVHDALRACMYARCTRLREVLISAFAPGNNSGDEVVGRHPVVSREEMVSGNRRNDA